LNSGYGGYIIKVLMLKQKNKNNKRYNFRFIAVTAALLFGVVSGLAYQNHASADRFDEKIKALQNLNVKNESASERLANQANSYQDAINKLASQIGSLQQTIDENQAISEDLQVEIKKQQAELDHQRDILGKNIRAMYLEGETSTLEILASSNDLSDYVNREEYRNSVQDKVRNTMTKINDLKKKLQRKQAQLRSLIASQKEERLQLAVARAEQQSLLDYTAAQKAAYEQKIKSNQSKIAELRRQQAIENARYSISTLSGDPNHGGYPRAWDNAPQDSLVDYWGMYNRECVSYTAFKAHKDFTLGRNNRDMPYWGGRGNANQWDDNARSAGIPVNSTPKRGSIAISNAGYYGHAMYVESVGTINGAQAIYVSQYNAQLNGRYSEGWRYTTGLVFLHF
jgi:peptidoglycan DL-endopeptidase CwlO